MENKRTTDLFRFATLRAPQQLSDERRSLGFIYHPDQSQSTLFDGVNFDTDTFAEMKTKIANNASSFTPFSKVDEVKGVSSKLYEFAHWLSVNKNVLKRSELDVIVTEATTPVSITTAQYISLWDNVYYDLIVEENSPIRQACLQCIVAQNFINKYQTFSLGTTTDEAEMEKEAGLLKRLAHGKVVVHNALSSVKVTPTSTSAPFATQSFQKIASMHNGYRAGLKVPALEAICDDLLDLGESYSAEYQAAYSQAMQAYEGIVKEAVDRYISENPDIQNQENMEDQIPANVAPVFKFNFDAALSVKYRAGKVSGSTDIFIRMNRLDNFSIKEAIDFVKKNMQLQKHNSAARLQKQVKQLSVIGVSVRPTSSKNIEFGLSFDMPRGKDQLLEKCILMTINTGYRSAFFESHEITLKVDDTVIQLNSPQILCSNGSALFVKLTGADLSLIVDGKQFELLASFELNNSKSYAFTKKGVICKDTITGYALTQIINGEDVDLYGINRIGVADYRKVEQELCCYVPGEVSHIENIMAKEYKERSTRNLTSTERTLESSSEREIEESNDTTTTARHEMNSEVANVIENDRQNNFGFNSSVSGNYTKIDFTAGAYADFSMGTSTSNSNSQAQSYAEDVTRRALERIVQKTTSKRTSRILREFEENNRHGFDNRGDDAKHVTGVYRWIDKVYKNRVVNYGKRLMYEFMLPEPSRYYKQAILVQAEEEGATQTSDQNSLTILKPIHPSEHGINGAESITREDYERFTSLYDVKNPEAPIDERKDITGGYNAAPGNGDSNHTFNMPTPVNVPTNYVCKTIHFNLNYHHKSWTPQFGGITISIAGNSKIYPNPQGSNNKSKSDTFSNLNIASPGNITSSTNTKKVTQFALTFTCECYVADQEMARWRESIYADILDAYEDQLRIWNEAQEQQAFENSQQEQENEENVFKTNPKFNQEIVLREMKRLCIEMLTVPFGLQQGKDFYQDGECEPAIPRLKLTNQLDSYSSHVKFFEQAFDWSILSSVFYPYYWAKKCDWTTLFQAQAGDDHMFRAFLQSGMARLIVPVREGFEDAVTFYMETGKIWNGNGMVIDTDDDLYMSIVDEMTILDQNVEKLEWETVVPSTLTVIQASSVALDEAGLPCCHSAEEQATLNLNPDVNVLQPQSSSTEPNP
ncbi:MAG: hypothetical protein HRT58_14075 [Crocinitomicaceae bacterium]|nr:hypothetical protein [Flavobacteriales bacterium]NQZ36792.1 hypothetical protein [Crocinitomicaceae bacterium]